MKRLAIAVINLYQRAVSPLFPPSCRFTPTCSQYAKIAIMRFGAARGGWMAFRRIMRCHPFHPGGCDPVPESPELKEIGPAHPPCCDEPAES